MAISTKRIGLKEVRGLQPGETVWDGAVSGFHARRQKGEAISFLVTYRTAEGRQRWQTIGRHGSPWTPDTAREEARRILGRVAQGSDPAADKYAKRQAKTVAELCDLYMADAEAGKILVKGKSKRPSTILTDRGRVERHIKPLIGAMKVTAVTKMDIDDFLHAVAQGKSATRAKTQKNRGLANVRGGKGTATRTVGLLGAIFTYAVRKQMVEANPVNGVIRFADGAKKRRLRDSEYELLAHGLDEAEKANIWPPAIAATRFLAVTGWRSGEALSLTWSQIDLEGQLATLTDTKTGESIRPLSKTVCDLLRSLHDNNRSGLVFTATRGDRPMTGYPKFWAKIAKLGTLPSDITPHTLRHSFASLANDIGLSEPTIAMLVGHRKNTMTSRYIHSADKVLLAAADAVATATADRMTVRIDPVDDELGMTQP